MAARHPRLTLLLACAVLLTVVGPQQVGPVGAQQTASRTSGAIAQRPVKRIVSLVPALTEMLFVIGAGADVVGVSSFDSFPPAVKALPRVGALLDPDVERILALRPDLVLTYASQADVQARFERAGIQIFTYRHGGIDDVLNTMRRLGASVGRTAEANATARSLEQRLEVVRNRVKGRPRPRTLLVFERTPHTIRGLYVSGGSGFLNDMLNAAGGVNVFDDVKRESVQPSQETLLTRAPEVIVEIRANSIANAEEERRDHTVWNALASLPAVRQKRVYFLSGDQLVVPGPRLADGVELIARALHPDAFR
jgi:iron complex transport system substrate-binding protein